MALGMWACAILNGQLVHGFGLLCLGLILLTLTSWKHASAWFVIGWCTFELWHGVLVPNERLPLHAPSTEWVLVCPRFLPEVAVTEGERLCRGVWDARDGSGRRFRVWMESTSSELLSEPRWGWMTLQPVEESDITSSFPFDRYLASTGVQHIAHLHFWDSVNSHPSPVDSRSAHSTHVALLWRNHLRHLFSGSGQGLILGVFAGERKAVPESTRESFAHLGLGHLLSVSGYHVGLVAGIFLLFLRFQNRWWRRLSGFGVLASGLFVLACGFPVSGVRSWVMLTLGWWSLVRGRRSNLWGAWGAAACLAALNDGTAPLGLGAQLSFLATGSLLALHGKHLGWRVPLRAQMSTASLTLPAFGTVPLAFYPANLFVGPVMVVLGVLVGLSLAGVPQADRLASWWACSLEAAVSWSDATATTWCDSRFLSGEVGILLLLPIASFWMIRMIPGELRRRVVRSCLCASCALMAMGISWNQSIENRSPEEDLSAWALRGRPSCRLVTDGFGACAWCSNEAFDSQPTPAHHAVRSLHLEGPVWVMRWQETADSTQKKWIQPPFQAWIHRNATKSSSEPVLLE